MPAEAVLVTTVAPAEEAPPAEEADGEGQSPAAEEPYVEEADIVVTVAAPTTAGEP